MYSGVVPLSSEAHRNHTFKADGQALVKAKNMNLIPAVLDEFAVAAPHLPIMFVPTVKGPSPVFVCGIATGTNAFINDEGKWTAGYIPAYLRRYPFILGDTDGENPILCIDSAFEGFAADPEGQRLFDEEGASTTFLQGVIQLTSDYARSASRSEEIMKKVAELGLLTGVSVDGTKADGTNISLQGMAILDQAWLNDLPDEDFLALRKAGALEALFAQKISMAALKRVTADA
jgi:hypothetical protein